MAGRPDSCVLAAEQLLGLGAPRERLSVERQPVGVEGVSEIRRADGCPGAVDDLRLPLAMVGLEAEYRAAYEGHQADEAMELVAWLHHAGRRYTKYVETARRLGSDHRRPVVALAESAIAGSRLELAVDVLRAADEPGHHREHLRTKCLQLTGVSLGDGQLPAVGASE